MTFYCYNMEDGESIRNKFIIDKKRLQELYNLYFTKYAFGKNIKFLFDKPIKIDSNDEYLIENYNIIKKDNQYEISYTIYNYPKVCRIINNLLNSDTFLDAYADLQKNLLSTRKDKIEEVRRKLDMQIRVLSVMLDEPDYDYQSAIKNIREYSGMFNSICDFDKNLASDLVPVAEAINVEKIKDKKINNSIYFEPNKCVKTKKLSSF